MSPTLTKGRVAVFRRKKSYKHGEIVLIYHAGLEKIKRIAKISGDNVYLIGDNAAHSTDSRHFGAVPKNSIRGAAILLRKRPKNAKISL